MFMYTVLKVHLFPFQKTSDFVNRSKKYNFVWKYQKSILSTKTILKGSGNIKKYFSVLPNKTQTYTPCNEHQEYKYIYK